MVKSAHNQSKLITNKPQIFINTQNQIILLTLPALNSNSRAVYGKCDLLS